MRLAVVDQTREALPNDKSAWEAISNGQDILTIGRFEIQSRAYLGRFNFKGSDQQKIVGNLSGGERGRLMLARPAAIKLIRPSVKVIGAEPEFAADAQASLRAGKIVHLTADEVTRTVADGLRTQSIGPINFEHMLRYVDDIVSVGEDEIREAMRQLASNPKTVAEPSGAVAVAAFLFHRNELPRTKLNVAIISGGNIEPQMLADITQSASTV